MACESEAALVSQLSSAVSEKAAYCSSICSSLGNNSTECQGCRDELATLQSRLAQAQEALQKCLVGNPPPATAQLLQTEGHVTFLLVVEQGTGYGGGQTNWIDADVIFKLDSRPDQSFGFQLRDDPLQPVRRGMLALLRDAIVHGLKVITDYNELAMPPNQNSFVIRVALANFPQPGAVLQTQL
jgi:hypothetical protein